MRSFYPGTKKMNFEDLDSRFNSWCHSEICRANHRFIPITIQFLKIELKHPSKKNMGETKFYQNFYLHVS